MEITDRTVITIEAIVNVPVEKVWELWTDAKHITQWNYASDDWHCPAAENDLRPGGKFSSTMAAKDGSFSFDFWGVYDEVKPNELIAYTMGDGRKAEVHFAGKGKSTYITSTFEAEKENPIEMQRGGWQAILDNFKKYAESVK